MSKYNPEANMNSSFLELREQSGLSPKHAARICGVTLKTIYRWDKNECKPHRLAIEKLEGILQVMNSVKPVEPPSFRFIDLFAGIGGFRKAFEAIGGECVFTSEWDGNSRKTYQANYNGSHVYGDIREFTKDDESLAKIPQHDVLVAGFPCQPFSIAGVSKKNALGRAHGFKDLTQGTLFFDLAEIIEFHEPTAFLLENVKNLVSHDGGNTFKFIKGTLQELGYHIECKVIDGQHWVPQHRERIFIVGFKKDVGFRFSDLEVPDKDSKPALASILHQPGAEPDEIPYMVNGEVGEKYTLTPRLWEYLQGYAAKHKAAGNGFGFGLFGPDDVARTLSARYYKDGSEILIKQEDGERPRRLTPRECARLMGFDQPGEPVFKIPVSDTQAYRQFGNSVIVPAATAIARLMKPFIFNEIRAENKNTKKNVQNVTA